MEHFPGAFEPIFQDCSNPGPVPLDRLNLTFTTHSPLINLPIEVLNIIIQYLPEHGLGGLALANSDCRQIARTRQFCKIKLEFSENNEALLQHIVKEHKVLGGLPQRIRHVVPIGHCVRAIVFANETEQRARHFQHFSQPNYSGDHRGPSAAADAAVKFPRESHNEYIGHIAKICNTSGVLPNLELLDLAVAEWRASLPVWWNLNHIALRYLKLPVPTYESTFSTLSSKTNHQFHCPRLQRLELREYHLQHALLYQSLRTVTHLASSLESLTWLDMDKHMLTFRHENLDSLELPPLINLRRAHLSAMKIESTLLKAVLASPRLAILGITQSGKIPTKILNDRGTIPTLLHLTTSHCSSDMIESIWPFIAANTQLSQLRLNQPLSNDFLSSSLLPTLAHSCHSLACLALVWKETTIPSQSLRLLSRLPRLTRLFLSARFQKRWRPEFLVDHVLVLNHLSQLPKLRELVFHNDTYDNGHGWSDPSDYYEHRRMNDSGHLDYAFQPAHERFEIIHKRRMLDVARDYGNTMPSLEWLFVGQYPFAFDRSDDGDLRCPRFLCESRFDSENSKTGQKVIGIMFGSFDPTFGFD